MGTDHPIRLTRTVKGAGCAAKPPPPGSLTKPSAAWSGKAAPRRWPAWMVQHINHEFGQTRRVPPPVRPFYLFFSKSQGDAL